ncbi:hypothetical protein D3C73_995640 [compost metagenome]
MTSTSDHGVCFTPNWISMSRRMRPTASKTSNLASTCPLANAFRSFHAHSAGSVSDRRRSSTYVPSSKRFGSPPLRK